MTLSTKSRQHLILSLSFGGRSEDDRKLLGLEPCVEIEPLAAGFTGHKPKQLMHFKGGGEVFYKIMSYS